MEPLTEHERIIVGDADDDAAKQPNDDVWRGQPKDIKPTKDEEFEQYFTNMFL